MKNVWKIRQKVRFSSFNLKVEIFCEGRGADN